MVKTKLSIVLLLAFFSTISVATANTDKLDNIAACSGMVLGNGAVDLFLGDEASFDAAANMPMPPISQRHLPLVTSSLINKLQTKFSVEILIR